MKVELHTLAWPDSDATILAAHRSVMAALDLDIRYSISRIAHGDWMNQTLASSDAEVIGFVDADCVPTNRAIVDQAIDYAAAQRSFAGVAQVSNHIGLKSHIFAAPSFFFICREAWHELQRPTFLETPNADVAENVSYAAEQAGKRYRTLYPTHWSREPQDGAWWLHTYGVYGIGTHYEGGVFHLFEGRHRRNVDLFVATCREIVGGRFSTDGMIPTRAPYAGHMHP